MPVKKSKAPVQVLKPVKLPEHVHVSNDELAVVTRLVRIMRLCARDDRGTYWLGPFIEWLLYLDVTDPDLKYIHPKWASDALEKITGEFLYKSSAFMKTVAKEYPGLHFVSLRPSKSQSGGDALPQDEEEQFYHLLRLWRMDHPQPPKQMQRPKGITQHESDPDSD